MAAEAFRAPLFVRTGEGRPGGACTLSVLGSDGWVRREASAVLLLCADAGGHVNNNGAFSLLPTGVPMIVSNIVPHLRALRVSLAACLQGAALPCALKREVQAANSLSVEQDVSASEAEEPTSVLSSSKRKPVIC